MPDPGRRKKPESRVTVYCANADAHAEPEPIVHYRSYVKKNKTGRFFCSTECRDAAGAKPRRREMRTCERSGCGITFYPRTPHQRFCSTECADLVSRTKTKVKQTCLHCGKVDYVSPSRVGQFCGREHYDAYRAEHAAPKTYPSVQAPPDHPRAWENGRIAQHVFVMEEMLGRYLLPGENVHHKNGNRKDARPANLELFVSFQPHGQRPDDLADYAEELLRRYRPASLTRSLRERKPS